MTDTAGQGRLGKGTFAPLERSRLLKTLYQEQLRPRLEGMEAQRRAARNFSFLTFSCVGLVFIGVAAKDHWIGWVLIAAGIAGAGYFGIKASGLQKEYRARFKKDVVREVFTLVDGDLAYRPDHKIPHTIYADSELFLKRVDRYRGDDYCSGRHGATDFEFSELHTEYKRTTTDSKGRRRTTWHTIFHGIFFSADFHKHIRSETFVLPDRSEKWFGKTIGQFFQSKSFGRDDLVKLENPEFEEHFVVYSNDQVDARYILTPDMMRRILDLREKVDKNVALAFKGTRVYVAVSYGRRLFEPRLFRSGIDFEQIEEFHTILDDTLGIVDGLNLNTRIWTKE